MSKIISIANFKGGVGKTTSTLNIGAGLSNDGKKVLLIDLDPQFNLTQSLGIEDYDSGIYEALTGKDKIQIIEINQNLHLVPSSLSLIKAEKELSGAYRREFILSKLLKPIKDNYNFILLDCPPSLGSLTVNAFVASDLILVPIEAEYLALKGYTILREALSEMEMTIDRVFITKYDSRKILNKNVLESIKGSLGDVAFKTVIRSNVSLAEAPAEGVDIFRYNSKSNGAEDYLSLCKEILKDYK